MGEGDCGRIPKGFCALFDLGRRADHPMIFHIFSISFYHRFLVSNCSKFCVKMMGSTVRLEYCIIHFYFGADFISVISLGAFFYVNLISTEILF